MNTMGFLDGCEVLAVLVRVQGGQLLAEGPTCRNVLRAAPAIRARRHRPSVGRLAKEPEACMRARLGCCLAALKFRLNALMAHDDLHGGASTHTRTRPAGGTPAGCNTQ
jgi:hypothetical protein